MKAMMLRENRPIEKSPLHLKEVPKPQPGPHKVRLKVRTCGICRTDLHVIEGELPPVRAPLIPGHQIVGVADRRGERAGRFQVGDRLGIAGLRWATQDHGLPGSEQNETGCGTPL